MRGESDNEGLFKQLMSAQEYEQKYRSAPRGREKALKAKTRSLGTTDWMGQADLLEGAQNINYMDSGLGSGLDFSVQRSSWNTGDGMTVTTSTPNVPSQTYTLTSALSMK